MKRRLVLCLIGCLLAALPVLAQEGPRGNQLLLDIDDELWLWDATEDSYEFLVGIDPNEFGQYGWSPDGRYLLAQSFDPLETRLYDVTTETWDERVLGGYGAWSPDGESIVHVRPMENGSELLLYDWESGENTVLYTTQGTEQNPEGLSEPEWSPNGESILFVRYRWRLGGTDNFAKLLNVATGVVHDLAGGWYASYNPIWSPDGDHFLLDIATPTQTGPSGFGDIYLFNAHTGEERRVTNTPLQDEWNIRWTEDGQTILYDVTETKFVALVDIPTLSQTADETLPEISQVIRQGATYMDSASPDGSIQVWRGGLCEMLVSDAAGDVIGSLRSPLAGSICPTIRPINWRPLPTS